MNIFFSASLRGKKQYLSNYKKIHTFLKRNHTVFADHIFKIDVNQVHEWDPDYRFEYYQILFNKIRFADTIVAEISSPSINVGYEVCIAKELRKNVIVLYTGNEEPQLISKLEPHLLESKVEIIQYTMFDLEEQLFQALRFAKKTATKRFTILLPTHIVNYLDIISKKLDLPRALYIRQLIEKDMNKVM